MNEQFPNEEKQSEVEPLDKKHLREFSRHYHPEERIQAAKEAKKIRSAYFSRNETLSQKIRDLDTQIERQDFSAEATNRRIMEINELIANEEARLFTRLSTRIKKFFGSVDAASAAVKELKEDQAKQQARLNAIATEKAGVLEEIKDLYQQKEARGELEEAKARIDTFYGQQAENWRTFEAQEAEARSVANIIRDYRVMFVHGTLPDYVPLINSIIKKGTDWKTKVKIALAAQPELSTSAIHPWDNAEAYWSWIGLVLTDGYVTHARNRDAATQAIDAKTRTGTNGWKERGEKMITEALSGNGGLDGMNLPLLSPKLPEFISI